LKLEPIFSERKTKSTSLCAKKWWLDGVWKKMMEVTYIRLPS